MEDIVLLALSGSLRRESYNTAVIEALKYISADSVCIKIASIANLPLFNPDREQQHIEEVEVLINGIRQADGLVIASPEYAHGISGPMKNALDWLVSTDVFPDKPVMLINTSPRATHAQAALREVISTMSANIIDDACVSVPLLGSGLNAAGIAENPHIVSSLAFALTRMGEQIRYSRSSK